MPRKAMALYPEAKLRLLPENQTQARIAPRVAILHSVGGASSPYQHFLNGSDLESTFGVLWDGTVEQYVDTIVRADANYKANPFAISIETVNSPHHGGRWDDDPWSPEQVASITRLLHWICKTHGIPARRVERWDGSGIGWHIQFGTPGWWTPVAKACPGRRRIQQFNQIIIPALTGAYNGGTPVTKAEQLQIIAGVDSILKDDFRNLKAELNADITNAANRVIRDLGGEPSIPNKR
jgi:hypothetical protein